MNWTVSFSTKAGKQYKRLARPLRAAVSLLVKDIQFLGPVRGNWKNYCKLGSERHHCHIKTGRPTYVACWRVMNKEMKIVEVYYVGTHEKAPY